MPGHVHFTIEGATAHLALDNPGRRNAVSFDVFEQLGEAITTIAGSDAIHVVVLSGKGSDFSVGADLSAPPETRTLRRDSVAGDTARLRQVSDTLLALYRLPQVTIAAIDGACAGAGLSLAAAADFRIASERAVFNTAFVTAGLSGDLGGAWLVNNLVGAARARELFLTPGKVPAARALELGLVHSVASTAELDATVAALAEKLAATAPLALRAMKENLIQSSDSELPNYLPDEIDRMVRCSHSNDATEAAAAFLDKRAPAFAGR